MKTFTAFLSALLICASTNVGAFAFDPEVFPEKGREADYRKALKPANKGKELLDKGRYREAVETYEKAISIYPYDAAVYSNKGIALSELNEHTQAIAAFRKAIELAPTFAAAVNNLSDELRILKDYKGAEQLCRRASQLEPKNPIPVVTLAEICIDTKRFSEAKQLLGKASKLAPGTNQEQAVTDTIKQDLAKIPRNGK